jgi:hypothetical protein
MLETASHLQGKFYEAIGVPLQPFKPLPAHLRQRHRGKTRINERGSLSKGKMTKNASMNCLFWNFWGCECCSPFWLLVANDL